jgi:methionine synthase II (cobalamin-independent)
LQPETMEPCRYVHALLLPSGYAPLVYHIPDWVSPAQLAGWNKNEFYKTDEEFGLALAGALREEYRAIVDAGLVLQIPRKRRALQNAGSVRKVSADGYRIRW